MSEVGGICKKISYLLYYIVTSMKLYAILKN